MRPARLFYAIATTLVLCTLLAGCWGSPAPAVSDAPPVTFRPARISLDAPELVNPMRGLYRWMGQEEAPLPQPAQDAYDRYTWRDLEPTRGDYRFDKLEDDIAQAAREGRKFAFRVRSVVSTQGTSVPDYLMAGMKLGWWYDYDDDGKPDTYVPDWNDAFFLTRAAALVAALGERYDKDKRIAFVDIGLYGNWGEWHMSSFPYPSPSGAQRITRDNKQRIVDMHIDAFPTAPLVMLTDDADALVYAMKRSPRVGWRRDSLGWVDKDHFEKIESDTVRWDAIKDRWKTAPVVTEFANPRFQKDPAAYEEALDEVRRYHVSLVSNGNTLKWSELSSKGKDAFMALAKATGYRLALDQLRIPGILNSNSEAVVQLSLSNAGVAPVYEPWQVVVQLRSTGDAEVAWEGISTLDLHTVLPGAPVAHTDTFAIGDVAPGLYALVVVVRDPRGTRAPLALASEGRQADGSYRLGTLMVQ